MKRTASTEVLLDLLRNSKLVDGQRLDDYLMRSPALPTNPKHAAGRLVKDGLITSFQAEQLLAGRYKGFFLLGGQYKVLKPIGRGGMGAVYLCEHLQLNRRVAVKALPKGQTCDPATLERFQREARAAAALDHPNIVHVYDVSAAPGLALLVMEYAEGKNLQDILDADGAIPYRKAAGYVAQAAAGLQHAHERGVVHRDVKPANLVLDRSGVVKILDMGLARFVDKEDRLTQKFDGAAVLGTADYMSPEQAVASGRIDVRTDIYSLGVTLYALVSGKPPFSGSITEKLMAHQIRDAVPPHKVRPEVPEALSAVVARMMAKKPEHRYATAADVIDALAPFVDAPPTPSSGVRRPSRSVKAPLWLRRPVVAGAAGVVGLLLVALVVSLGAWLLHSGDRASAAPIAAAIPPAAPPPPAPPPSIPEVKAPPAQPAKPPTPPPAPQPMEKELYRLNLDEQQPFLFHIEHAEYYNGAPFPDSWAGHCWKDGSVADVLAERVGGSMALGFRNASGDASCQLLTNLSGVAATLQAGRRYVLRVEYQGQKQANATVYVRRGDSSSFASIPLHSTDGHWTVVETPIEQEAESARDIAFCAAASGPDSTIYVRLVVLVERLQPDAQAP